MKQIAKLFSAVFIVVVLLSASGCASTSRQQGAGEYFDDSLITAKVKTAVLREPTLKVTDINVETFKGAVQLSGFASSEAAVDRAVEVARRVGGVTAVKHDIRVR